MKHSPSKLWWRHCSYAEQKWHHRMWHMRDKKFCSVVRLFVIVAFFFFFLIIIQNSNETKSGLTLSVALWLWNMSVWSSAKRILAWHCGSANIFYPNSPNLCENLIKMSICWFLLSRNIYILKPQTVCSIWYGQCADPQSASMPRVRCKVWAWLCVGREKERIMH